MLPVAQSRSFQPLQAAISIPPQGLASGAIMIPLRPSPGFRARREPPPGFLPSAEQAYKGEVTL